MVTEKTSSDTGSGVEAVLARGLFAREGYGHGLRLDGIDDYIDCGSNVVLNSNVKTLEVVFEPDTVPSDGSTSLIAGKNRFYLVGGYCLYMVYNRLVARVWDGGGTARVAGQTTGKTPVSAGNLYYGVLVHDYDNDELLIYLNGTHRETKPIVGFTSVATSFKIGRRGDTSGYWFDGKIYQIRFSDSVRTLEEIAANWNGGAVRPFELDEHTVALWHLNEGSGATAYDETDNDNDGTIYGASWVEGVIPRRSGLDALVSRLLAAVETGAGVDAAELIAALTMAETGAGVDASTLLAILSGADAGSGIEALIARLLAASELGTGSDQFRVKLETALKGGGMKLSTPKGEVSIPSKEESI